MRPIKDVPEGQKKLALLLRADEERSSRNASSSAATYALPPQSSPR